MHIVSDATGIQLRNADGGLLGSLTWHITTTREIIVDSIFVAEHARRQGLGTKLGTKHVAFIPTSNTQLTNPMLAEPGLYPWTKGAPS